VPTDISLLGVTPVTGTLITLNQIERESIDIAINNATGGLVVAHLNNLVGRGTTGIANLGPAGPIDATENWWGCPNGPRRGRLQRGVGRQRRDEAVSDPACPVRRNRLTGQPMPEAV
jgi:hypothetical protein